MPSEHPAAAGRRSAPAFPASSVALAAGALAVGTTFGAAGAWAATTATFDVTATVTPGCLVDGLGSSGNAGRIGTLDFGTVSTFSTQQRTATTTTGQAIRLRCTPGVNLIMTIDGGTHAASGQRNLQRTGATTARIPYALCRDAACTLPIVAGTAYGNSIGSTNSEDVRLPIFAALTPSGTMPPGTYTDTLIVTLTW
nr:spore coat U domain-containing protein [uncultured Novosphingobium sp.]